MRFMIFAGLAALVALIPASGLADELGRLPFPVERGSAPPPPAPQTHQSAPPEGEGAAGFAFGQWRSADPAAYAQSLQEHVNARYANQEAATVRRDLEANGFACEDGQRLDCRIEIMERACAYDWYVVIERGRREPVAGFDQMCLGAQR
ncbi:MAG: hypothetical protein JNJ63_10390 [Hyphomonadaceae bacterium]|nr:hypothetical protein [Hyphomonadaceae bacterium]